MRNAFIVLFFITPMLFYNFCFFVSAPCLLSTIAPFVLKSYVQPYSFVIFNLHAATNFSALSIDSFVLVSASPHSFSCCAAMTDREQLIHDVESAGNTKSGAPFRFRFARFVVLVLPALPCLSLCVLIVHYCHVLYLQAVAGAAPKSCSWLASCCSQPTLPLCPCSLWACCAHRTLSSKPKPSSTWHKMYVCLLRSLCALLFVL